MNYGALNKISYGVYVVSSAVNGKLNGCVANAVMQITAEPPSVAVSINRENLTNEFICESGKFSVSVLPQNAAPVLFGMFGYRSGRDISKFDGVKYHLHGGLPVLDDSCAGLVCEVTDKMETETHTVFLGKVVEAFELSDGEPMTYSYFHNVIKGKSPKNAPTYIAE